MDLAHMVECSHCMREVQGSIPCFPFGIVLNDSLNRTTTISNYLIFMDMNPVRFYGYESTANGGELGRVVVKVRGSIPMSSFQIRMSVSRYTWNKEINVRLTNIITIYRTHCCGLYSQRLRCLLGVYLREVSVREVHRSLHRISISYTNKDIIMEIRSPCISVPYVAQMGGDATCKSTRHVTQMGGDGT